MMSMEKAYELMKIGMVIGDRRPDMDYEQIFELAGKIYEAWKSLTPATANGRNEVGYSQEFAARYLDENED